MANLSHVRITEVHDMGDGTALISGTIDGIAEPGYEPGEGTTRSTVRKAYTLAGGTKRYIEDIPLDRRQNVSVDGEDAVEVTHSYACQVLSPPERWPLKTLATLVPLASLTRSKDKLAAAKNALSAAYPVPAEPKALGISG